MEWPAAHSLHMDSTGDWRQRRRRAQRLRFHGRDRTFQAPVGRRPRRPRKRSPFWRSSMRCNLRSPNRSTQARKAPPRHRCQRARGQLLGASSPLLGPPIRRCLRRPTVRRRNQPPKLPRRRKWRPAPAQPHPCPGRLRGLGGNGRWTAAASRNPGAAALQVTIGTRRRGRGRRSASRARRDPARARRGSHSHGARPGTCRGLEWADGRRGGRSCKGGWAKGG